MNLTDDEMRVKVAETDGWKSEIRRMYGGAKNVKGWGKNQHLHPGDKDRDFTTHLDSLPDYLNDLNAALTLCDRLREEGFGVVIVGPSNHGNWFVDFTTLGTTYRSEDPSLARAICLAFLKVKGESL